MKIIPILFILLLNIQLSASSITSEYEKLCELNIAKACLALGVMYEYGDGIEKNHQLAAAYYEKTCNEDSLCRTNGTEYIISNESKMAVLKKRVTKKINIVAEDKECIHTTAIGCKNLGNMYSSGSSLGKNYQKAVKYYTKACERNHDVGCYNLAVMYDSGLGVSEDKMISTRFYTQACKLGNAGGCYNAGIMYYIGDGIEIDHRKAKLFFSEACDKGNENGCKNYKALNR